MIETVTQWYQAVIISPDGAKQKISICGYGDTSGDAFLKAESGARLVAYQRDDTAVKVRASQNGAFY